MSQTYTLINATVLQEVSKNFKHIPNVNPFMSQFMWNIISLLYGVNSFVTECLNLQFK